MPFAGAAKLRRAMWIRMHPVGRWTLLVDLGRRGAYLVERPIPRSPATLPGGAHNASGVLGRSDPKVRFSCESTEAHRQLCEALPYPARLHLSLSLLMWVRCLRDIQDTLARVRLPFAMVRRLQRYAVADVFPTRLAEHWVDVHTTVATKMSAQLNSTAEQVPAPHAWDPETSQTVEDAEAEATVAVDAGRVLHGRHLARRTGPALLRQVQGVQPRASAEDDAPTAAGPTEADALGLVGNGGRRRRLPLRLRQSTRSPAEPAPGPAAVVGNPATADVPGAASLEFASDACRRVPPVSLESQSLEDEAYHGNAGRGEGCPLRQDGTSSPTPIFIHVPPCDAELLTRHCVMAHAAVLSSLFVEGRVVDFASNHPVVVAYVRWLMEELVLGQYVSVTLVGELEAAVLRPFYPTWCWTHVLVVLPPSPSRRAPGTYTAAVVREWAARVVQAAPCAVIVEGGAGSYVCALQAEVQRLQGDAGAQGGTRKVEWVPIVPSSATGTTPPATPDTGASSKFQPQRPPDGATATVTAAGLGQRALSWFGAAKSVRPVDAARHRAHAAFLAAVCETLEDRFYTCELLYSPRQSCLTPYRFERWVWERLPANVRVVGVNTAPLDVLYFFPQGVFLGLKVGNAFRYRAIERTVVAKDTVPSWSSHPLRYAAMMVKWGARWGRQRLWRPQWRASDVASGLHAELSPTDRALLAAAVDRAPTTSSTRALSGGERDEAVAADGDGVERAARALVKERAVEYLAEPCKRTLLGLVVAHIFKL